MSVDKVDWNIFTYIIGGIVSAIASALGIIWKRINYHRHLTEKVNEKLAAHIKDLNDNYPKTSTVKDMLDPMSHTMNQIQADVRMLVQNEINHNGHKE